jgi:hypothetical protein
MGTTTAVTTIPVEVQRFLETVVAWPVERWRATVADAPSRAHAPQRVTAVALCDAILAHEARRMDAWFAEDAAQTVADQVQVRLAPGDHLLVRTLLADAALAILARPALPTLDYALLMAPFLPLYLP